MTLLQDANRVVCSECGVELSGRGTVQMALLFDMTARMKGGRLEVVWHPPATGHDLYCRSCGADIGWAEVVQGPMSASK